MTNSTEVHSQPSNQYRSALETTMTKEDEEDKVVDLDEGQDDIVWNEHQIWEKKTKKKNGDDGDDDEEDDDEEDDDGDHDNDELDNELTQQMFHFFDTKSEPEFETYKFQISSSSSSSLPSKKLLVDLSVRGEPETNNSTGMGLWRGAEVLAQYMCDVHTSNNASASGPNPSASIADDDEHTAICRPYPNFEWKDQRVLEVGAGLGLTGLTAYQLGASSVLMTDGDKDVLQNLRYNVKQNLNNNNNKSHPSSSTDPSGETTDTSSTSATTTTTTSISCPQLIWGQRLQEFRTKFGYQSVILAADCVYMAPSVEPLWQTIDALLDPLLSHAHDDDDDDTNSLNNNVNDNEQQQPPRPRPHGVVMYVNVSASTASPQSVLKAASKYGFTWTSPAKEVMLFRRRHPGEEPPEIPL